MSKPRSPDTEPLAAEALAASAVAAISAFGPTLAFDATVGALAQTLAAPPPGEAAPRGPRTLDAQELPLVSIATTRSDDAGGPDLVVEGRLGEGGMGVVELAHQRSLQREVALKRLRSDAPPQVAGALLREAMYTGYLEHPSIVPVHALGRDAAHRPLMLMKKIEGVSLEALVRDPAHEAWSRARGDRLGYLLEVAQKLCDAIAFAHSRGVLHRDLKPANVMLGEFGEVYLLDWGIAVRIGERLGAGAVAGTPSYMAPEMLNPASGAIDERTDVYLLGATLHDCVTGAPPHAGATLGAVLLEAAESRPKQYGDEVPEELASILRRAMQAEPSLRFESAAELGRALAHFGGHRAASELAHVALERLGELEAAIAGGLPSSDVRALFHECRFAFEQSLRGWPEGEAAREGLRRARVAMLGAEITERNAPGAEALARELEPLPPELLARLEELRAELRRAEADRERLRRMEHDRDDAVARRQRTMAVRLAASVLLVSFVSIVTLQLTGVFRPGPKAMGVAMAPGGLLLGLVLYRGRKHFFANRVNRQMGFTFMTLFAVMCTNRILGAFLGRSLSDVTSGDALLLGTVAALSALTLRRVYFVPAAFFYVAALAAPTLGDRSLLALLAAGLLSVSVVALAPARLQAAALDDRREG